MFGAVFGAYMLFAFLLFAAAVVAGVFYVLTVQRSLRLTFDYHKLNPGLAWLLFIPFFNLVWHFILVIRLTNGIKGKMGDLGKYCGDAGWTLGLAASILYCCSFLLNRVAFLGWIVSIAGLVAWVLYWLKLKGFNSAMETGGLPGTAQGFPGAPAGAREVSAFCVHCGSKIVGDAGYCTSCGKKLF